MRSLKMRAKCGNCEFFIGLGDWDLCCSNPPEDEISCVGFLCYGDTAPCHNYKYKKRGDADEV
jgi:hypothetical protein